MMAFRAHILAIAAGLSVSACGAYREPPPLTPPPAWHGPTAEAASFESRWWRLYGDPELDGLVETALRQNLDIEASLQRITVARARLRQAVSRARPGISLDGSATRQRRLGRGGGDPDDPFAAFLSPDLDQWEVALGAAWEPDIFGSARLRRRAATLEIGATEAEGQAVRLAIASTVVRAWLLHRTLGSQAQSTHEALTIAEEATRLTERRFELGDVRRTDVEALRAEALSLRANLSEIDAARREAALSLDAALNVDPGTSSDRLIDAPLPLNLGAPTAGLPADLLTRRPDLLAAVARARAGSLLADAARRDALPNFTLGLLAGRLSSNQAGLAFDSNFGRATAAFAWPGLDIGRTRAAIRLADAEADAGFIEYRRAFRVALDEVERALARLEGLQIQLQHIDDALAARVQSLHLAEAAFRLGEISRLDLVDARRGLFEARNARIETVRAIGEAQADLALALGGGWLRGGETSQ